jgi:primosomal protein N'
MCVGVEVYLNAIGLATCLDGDRMVAIDDWRAYERTFKTFHTYEVDIR